MFHHQYISWLDSCSPLSLVYIRTQSDILIKLNGRIACGLQQYIRVWIKEGPLTCITVCSAFQLEINLRVINIINTECSNYMVTTQHLLFYKSIITGVNYSLKHHCNHQLLQEENTLNCEVMTVFSVSSNICGILFHLRIPAWSLNDMNCQPNCFKNI